MKKILGIFILMVLLFNGPIFGIQITKLIYLISIIYFFLYKKSFNFQQKKLLIYGTLLVLYGTSYTLIRGIGDFNMFNFSRLFTSLFSSILIVDLLKTSKSYDRFSMTKWIGMCAVVQGLIVFIAFISPSFKEFLLNFCGGSEQYNNKLTTLAMFRGIGWTYAQFSDLAIAEGLAYMCFIAYCISIRIRNGRPLKIIYYLLLLFMSITGIIIGRTFQIVVIIGFIFYTLTIRQLINKDKIYKDINYLIWYSFIFVGILIIFLKDDIPDQTLDWAFEMFNNANQFDKFETASTDELQTMWKLPENIIDIIFGTGCFMDPKTNFQGILSKSDVGIVNSIFYWGLFGSIFYYYCIICSFNYAAKSSDNKILRNLSYSLLLIILIYNIKGLGNGFIYSCLLLQWNIEVNRNSKIENRNLPKGIIYA